MTDAQQACKLRWRVKLYEPCSPVLLHRFSVVATEDQFYAFVSEHLAKFYVDERIIARKEHGE